MIAGFFDFWKEIKKMFRAFTEKNQAITFEVSDCPTMVSPVQLAMLARPGSPILRADSVCRCFDKYCEGDVYKLEDKRLGILIYINGFKLLKEDGVICGVGDLANATRIMGTLLTCKFVNYVPERTPVKFIYGGRVLTWHDFLANVKGRVFLDNYGVFAETKDIRPCVWMSKVGHPIFQGDALEKGIVCMAWPSPYIDGFDGQRHEIERIN